MYLNFFNLRKEPFNITPDPDLLFLSPSHKEALAAVVYGVKQRKGFVAIIGEVGVGKTTIIRSFLGLVNKQNLKTIYLFNANLSFKALLRTIYQNLSQVPETEDIYEMVDRLHAILIEQYKAGNNVVLVIDEAQNMPVETLENLRMLSNLESATDKLIQIVFSGQPEFQDKLNLASLRQLKQRIVITARILPLTRAESLAYIEHRLAKTAADPRTIFSGGALRQIVKRAAGIPRVVNILCDNCLVTSFGRREERVSAKVAREIIADLDQTRPSRLSWKLAAVAGVAVAACVAVNVVSFGTPASPQKSPPARPVATVTAAAPVKAVQGEIDPLPEATRAAGEAREGKQRKTVKRGDTLAELILNNYGTVNRQLIEKVKRSNPQIVDENLIVEGDRIYFPGRE